MQDKSQILAQLREEFERWEALLAELNEEEITKPQKEHAGGLSIKDEIAHLWAWQQISNARLEAAVEGHEPRLPAWPAELRPEAEEDLEPINAWIYETNRDRPWSDVYGHWQGGFLRLIRLTQALPEEDLLEVGHYAWLKDDALAVILESSCRHHREEHLEPLLLRLGWEQTL